VFLVHASGMTETSPLATVGSPLARHDGASQSDLVDMQVKQGRQVFGIELNLVGRDGREAPHDGVSVGELKVRGNRIISGYFKGEGGQVVDDDGWLATGDVGTIDPDGYVQLTDRAKDVIKSPKPHTDPLRMWAKRLIEKKPFKLVAVALANKMARIAFAIMRGTTVYREIPA
jgi:long-subunit acyl-CoA synthetase (AMP-forming)